MFVQAMGLPQGECHAFGSCEESGWPREVTVMGRQAPAAQPLRASFLPSVLSLKLGVSEN